MREGEIQEEWRTGLIVPVWKRKGDVHDPGKYRGITLLRNPHMKKKGRVVRGPDISEEFHSGRRSPLLFIAVVEVINRNASTRDILRKLLYADDLAVVVDSEADLQERLVDWEEIFGNMD